MDLTEAESPEEALTAVLSPELSQDCLRIVLTGERRQLPDLAALERLGAGRCFTLVLRDRTRPARDLWERAGEDNLTGLFLRELRAQWESAQDGAEREKLLQAARFGLAALENGEDCCP